MNRPDAIVIRPMDLSDLDAVLAIEQASYPTPWLRDHFLNEIEAQHSFPFVAIVEATVAGYLCMMSLFEEAQLLNIAVASRLRGSGIARQLMAHAMNTAFEHGAEFMALEVRASNLAAIALYESLGFVRTGTRQHYYDGKEDAVLMEKTLQGAN